MSQVVAYKRLLKQWKIINRQAQKVVAVAYRRWSFTRGSNCSALTGKILVFRIEVVAYGRWSHMEVRLYQIVADNALLNLQNSSYHTKAESNNFLKNKN